MDIILNQNKFLFPSYEDAEIFAMKIHNNVGLKSDILPVDNRDLFGPQIVYINQEDTNNINHHPNSKSCQG